ncbi:MAG: NYN domain-containing protein [Microcystaceae cyanobacterium]
MNTLTLNALLLVDGYNIIGSWTNLKQTRDRHGLAMARQELVESLIGFSSHQGYQTQVIFDSQYQKTPSSQEHYGPHLSVHFTAWKQTADTYIEKYCATFFRQEKLSPQRLIVATSDRDQQLTVLGYGAEWMSANSLAQSLSSSSRQVNHHQRDRRQPQGRFLGNRLDARMQAQLNQWREGVR